MQGNWVPSPQDEINQTLLLALASIFNIWRAPLCYKQEGKYSILKKWVKPTNYLKYESVTCWVLLPMVYYKACKCSLCLLAGLCWWGREEADSKNGSSPRSWLSDRRVIRIWTATQGKVHYTPYLFPFSGMLPWKRQLKLKIWLSLCGVCNEHQMEQCTHGCHVWKQQQSAEDVRRMTLSWHRLNVSCCRRLVWNSQLSSLYTELQHWQCNDMCLVYLYASLTCIGLGLVGNCVH